MTPNGRLLLAVATAASIAVPVVQPSAATAQSDDPGDPAGPLTVDTDGDIVLGSTPALPLGSTGEQYVVAVDDPATLHDVHADLLADGAMVTNTFDGAIPGLAATMDEATARSLAEQDGVAAVEPDEQLELFGTQNGAPWNLDRLDQRSLPLDSTYTTVETGAGVTAYVLDSGIRTTHVEFSGRANRGVYWEFGDGMGIADCTGHGTHVAATIGGSTWGVAKGVTIVPVKISGCSGTSLTSIFVEGVNWVIADHPAGAPAVVNISLGSSASAIIDDAVARLVADGITVVAAAGNDAQPTCAVSPARAPAAITVAASTITDSAAHFTNHGSCNDLFAPGVGIRSASHLSDTGSVVHDGTSTAAPHVAGAAALILQRYPSASPTDVWRTMSAVATRGALAVCCGDPNTLVSVAHTAAAPAPPPPTGPSWPLPVGDGPGVTSAGRGQLDVFVRGQDDALYVRHLEGGSWAGWAGLGGVVTSAPAAASRNPGQVDVFVRGQDNALWGRSFSGGAWGPWVGLGGILSSAPAVVSRSPNTLDVFVAGYDGALYHRHFDGVSWSGWSHLGGILAGAPAAAGTPGALAVFVRGRDSALWTRSFEGGGWSGWIDLGGILTTAPGSVALGPGAFGVFARGQDNAVWQRTRDGAGQWGQWTTIGGAVTSPVAAASPEPGVVDVFTRGVDDALWANRNEGGGFAGWSTLGGVLR